MKKTKILQTFSYDMFYRLRVKPQKSTHIVQSTLKENKQETIVKMAAKEFGDDFRQHNEEIVKKADEPNLSPPTSPTTLIQEIKIPDKLISKELTQQNDKVDCFLNEVKESIVKQRIDMPKEVSEQVFGTLDVISNELAEKYYKLFSKTS